MGSSAWVCFECRTAVRRPNYGVRDVPCPHCGQICKYLGYKIPVPPNREIKVWEALRRQLNDDAQKHADSEYEKTVRNRHNIEQEIKRLESRPENTGRTKAIRHLKRMLENL